MNLPLPLEPGTVIGKHYIIGSLINSGGFGAVYKGIDTSEGNRPCAIKETYDVSPAARRQALMEASILFTVKSKNLPQVYDALESNDRFYLIMQLIDGPNLLQLLKQRGQACSEKEVIAWMLPIMRVLQELHSRTPAILHRDIKPGNIILTRDQTAVLVDFGLTKLYEPGSGGNTQTVVRAISEGFSPVEQYLGNTSPQSDIYALGATMYFLLTGHMPPASINRSMRDELIEPRQLNPSLSPNVERALLKAMAIDAEDRFQSMREFAQALTSPVFSGHADPTVAGSAASTVVSSRSRQQSSMPPPSPASPVNLRNLQNLPAYQASSPPATYYATPIPPPGYVLVPQSALVAPVEALPSAFGQGCLWGLVQGIFAAVLLLALKKDAYFYVGIAVGILFYIFAGFRTTRKGGKTSRGGWAGFWAGITSTVLFWFTMLMGLLILVTQRVQADTNAALANGIVLDQGKEYQHAWEVVVPDIFKPAVAVQQAQPAAQQQQQGILYLLLVISVALLIAFGSGWLGGLWGMLSYTKQRSTLQGQPVQRRT